MVQHVQVALSKTRYVKSGTSRAQEASETEGMAASTLWGENAPEGISHPVRGMGSVRCELNGGEDRVSNLYLGRANLWHYQQLLCLLTEDGPGESPHPSPRLWSSDFQLKSWVCAGDGCEPIGPALIKAVEQADCCISSGLSLLLFYLMEKSFFCFSL